MPCVVTQSRSSSDSWMSSERRRTFCSPGMIHAPLPTTILNPRPAASPSGPACARRPEMISASFGSATLYKNMTHSFRRPFERQTELRKTADDQRPRRVVLEHDHPRTFGDLLLGIARVRE